ERTVGVEGQRSVARPGIEHGGQRVFVADNPVGVVRVRVVRQDVAAEGLKSVVCGGGIGRGGRVVVFVDRQADGGEVARRAARFDGVLREAVTCELVCVRRVRE